MNRKTLILSVIGIVVLGVLGAIAAVVIRNARGSGPSPAEVAAAEARTSLSGGEMSGLTSSEPKPPNEGEIIAVACKPGLKLLPGEFIFGQPGAFLKVSADGSLKQTNGVELIGVVNAFDSAHSDLPLELKVECAADTEQNAVRTTDAKQVLYVTSLKDDQFFSTAKGVEIQTAITNGDQNFFETKILTRCLDVDSETKPEGSRECIHPQLFAITDLNRNGKREYWYHEPAQPPAESDIMIGVIEEPADEILKVCPNCGSID